MGAPRTAIAAARLIAVEEIFEEILERRSGGTCGPCGSRCGLCCLTCWVVEMLTTAGRRRSVKSAKLCGGALAWAAAASMLAHSNRPANSRFKITRPSRRAVRWAMTWGSVACFSPYQPRASRRWGGDCVATFGDAVPSKWVFSPRINDDGTKRPACPTTVCLKHGRLRRSGGTLWRKFGGKPCLWAFRRAPAS